MKIEYTGIKFNNYPIFWKYNTATEQSVFLFTLQKVDLIENKQLVLNYLGTLEGVTIEGESAVIKKALKFSEKYPVRKIYSQKTFFSPLCNLVMTNDVTIIEVSLQLDKLILNTPSESSIWGKTLCYLHYFPKKIKKQAPVKYTIIKSELCFVRSLQHMYNKKLYKDRYILIKKIQKLFNENLLPSFEKIKGEVSLENFLKLRQFFQTAVVQAMEFNALNLTLTYSENLTKEERNAIYKTQKDYESAVYQERLTRAKTDLRSFIFFINHDISADLLTGDEELINLLTKLRISTQYNTCSIETIVNELKEIHIKIGIEQFIFEKDKKELQKDLIESNLIESYLSFNHLIRSLIGIYCGKIKKIDELVVKIKNEIHKKIDVLDLTGILQNTICSFNQDTNFYVSNSFYKSYIKSRISDKANFKRRDKIPNIIANIFESSFEDYKLDNSTQELSLNCFSS